MPITKRVSGNASGAGNTERVTGVKRHTFNPWGKRWGQSWGGPSTWTPSHWLVREGLAAMGATPRTSESVTPHITKRVG